MDVMHRFPALGRAAVFRFRILLGRAIDLAGDRVFGVNTRGHVQLSDLGVAAPNRAWYVPSPWGLLFRSLRALKVAQDDVLVDYGAGKGRVVVAAMQFPFRRIIGLEIAPDLAAMAQANVTRRARRAHSSNVHIVVADAAQWEVPDETTVVYMYCSVTGPVFTAAIERVLASVDRRPRRVRLVYFNPFEHNFLLASGRFRPVAVIRPMGRRGLGVTTDIVTYEVLPVSAEGVEADRRAVGEWAGFRDTSGLLPGFEPAYPHPA